MTVDIVAVHFEGGEVESAVVPASALVVPVVNAQLVVLDDLFAFNLLKWKIVIIRKLQF